MSKEIKRYEGVEAEVSFVPRHVEPFKDSPLWQYCVERHRDRWAGEKPSRRVPIFSFEGKTGWWFPAIWIEDFAKLPQEVRQPSRRKDGKSRYLAIGDWKFAFPHKERFRSWNLPAGTLIVAEDATVRYPDGTVEGWGSIQKRVGKHVEPSRKSDLDPFMGQNPPPQKTAGEVATKAISNTKAA